MDYISADDRELQELLRKSDAAIAKAHSPISLTELKQIERDCDRYLSQCKQIISRIELETRDMGQEDRSTVRQILRARATKIRELKNEFKWVQNATKERIKLAMSTENINNNELTKQQKKDKKLIESMDKYEFYDGIDDMGNNIEEKENMLMEYGKKNTRRRY